MIRFFLLNIFIAVCTILFSIWGILLGLFDRSGGRRVHFYSAVPWARTVLWVCGVDVHVKGLERIAAGGPRIFMSNHQSYFDIFALLGYLPADFKFILKQELMKLPFLGPAMRRAGYIAIDRGDPRRALRSMNEAARKIREGASVLIFPEGTRSEDGRLQDFKKGGFHLALKSGCEIVPVAIVNSAQIVPKGSLKIRKGRIGLHIGTPVPLKDYSKKEMDSLMNRIREQIAELLKAGETHE